MSVSVEFKLYQLGFFSLTFDRCTWSSFLSVRQRLTPCCDWVSKERALKNVNNNTLAAWGSNSIQPQKMCIVNHFLQIQSKPHPQMYSHWVFISNANARRSLGFLCISLQGFTYFLSISKLVNECKSIKYISF